MGRQAKVQRCPICGEPAMQETRPFCSRRCRDVDLARWLSGAYVVAGGNSDADEDGEQAMPGIERTGENHDEDGR